MTNQLVPHSQFKKHFGLELNPAKELAKTSPTPKHASRWRHDRIVTKPGLKPETFPDPLLIGRPDPLNFPPQSMSFPSSSPFLPLFPSIFSRIFTFFPISPQCWQCAASIKASFSSSSTSLGTWIPLRGTSLRFMSFNFYQHTSACVLCIL